MKRKSAKMRMNLGSSRTIRRKKYIIIFTHALMKCSSSHGRSGRGWGWVEGEEGEMDGKRENNKRLSEERLESSPEVDEALYKHTIMILLTL